MVTRSADVRLAGSVPSYFDIELGKSLRDLSNARLESTTYPYHSCLSFITNNSVKKNRKSSYVDRTDYKRTHAANKYV